MDPKLQAVLASLATLMKESGNEPSATADDHARFSTPNMRLRPKNRSSFERIVRESESVKEISRFFNLKFGFDPMKEPQKFDVTKESFSWKALKQKLDMKEADSATAFTQVLRSGVQLIANDMYKQVPASYEDWAKVVPSTKDEEPYAPLQGLGFPREVGRQEKYPEVGAAGLNLKLKHRKYGTMFAVEEDLVMDDQTGQFQQQAGLLGEYMKLVTEVVVYAKLASPTGGATYLDLSVPVSETKPSYEANYPWTTSASPFKGGGFNRATTLALLDQAGIELAYETLSSQKNLLGIQMLVNGSRLIVSAKNKFRAAVLLNSSYYPSGAAASGAPGGAFAINPIQGLADLTISRFLFDNNGAQNPLSTSWYLIDDSKPFFVVQQRESMYMQQEAKDSGESFERDIWRWKVRSRLNADFIDPRFAYQGNDGSVTS